MSDREDESAEAELDGLETVPSKGIRPGAPGDRDTAGDERRQAPPAPSTPPSRLPPGAAVRLYFPGANAFLDVPLGGELRLGRDASWAPRAAPLLSDQRTVSDQHAVVTCADDGTLQVEEVPRGSRNGVKVDTRVLDPGSPVRLRRGDTVWLGPRVSFTVQDPMGVLEP